MRLQRGRVPTRAGCGRPIEPVVHPPGTIWLASRQVLYEGALGPRRAPQMGNCQADCPIWVGPRPPTRTSGEPESRTVGWVSEVLETVARAT